MLKMVLLSFLCRHLRSDQGEKINRLKADHERRLEKL
jgi:hypothetical protein